MKVVEMLWRWTMGQCRSDEEGGGMVEMELGGEVLRIKMAR